MEPNKFEAMMIKLNSLKSLPTCYRCGRILTHRKSIKRGIGPECLKEEYEETKGDEND